MEAKATKPQIAPAKPSGAKKQAKRRILAELDTATLHRAEKAARAEGVSRSEFIRTAVEKKIEMLGMTKFERELAAACLANFERNLELLKEFEHVDQDVPILPEGSSSENTARRRELLSALRGSADGSMSTDEIIALTRGHRKAR